MNMEMFSNEDIERIKEDMSKHQKKIFDDMLDNPEEAMGMSLNKILFEFDREFIEEVLNIEINQYLKENKENNRRNGYIKDVSVMCGDDILTFNRPRLRKENDFDSQIIPKRCKMMDDLNNNILLLYANNNSVNQIKEMIMKMFKLDLSVGYISAVVQSIAEDVMEWRSRELKKCYFCINIDCTYVSIRDNKYYNSHKIPIYIAIGTTLFGHKEVLGIYLGNEDENKNIIDELRNDDIGESKTFWVNIFNDLKDRGLEKVLFISSDGLKGIEEAIKEEFEGVRYQRCVVHLVRNLEKYTTSKDKKAIIDDFKKIYTAVNKEMAMIERKNFIEKYKDKKTMVKHAEEYIEYILPLYDLPEGIRKYVYTNNIVESANSKVKRGFYGRGALPNPSSAINIVYFNLKALEEKWSKKEVNNWDKISKELQLLYPDVLEKYAQ